jgi:hypothetical protein
MKRPRKGRGLMWAIASRAGVLFMWSFGGGRGRGVDGDGRERG